MESKYSVFKEPWFTFVRVVEYVSWNLLLLLVWIFFSSLYLYFALKIGPTHKSPDWKTNSDQVQELWESTPCDIKSSAPVWFFVFVFSLSFLSPLFLVYLSVVVKKQQLVTPYGRKWQRLFEHLPVWTPPYAEEFGCLLSLINEKTEARVFSISFPVSHLFSLSWVEQTQSSWKLRVLPSACLLGEEVHSVSRDLPLQVIFVCTAVGLSTLVSCWLVILTLQQSCEPVGFVIVIILKADSPFE